MGALRITMRTSVVSVLRDEDVTIPCDVSGLNPWSAIAVLWRRKSEDGTENDVYEYSEGRVTVYRPGSFMDNTEIWIGNAELHIPRVQFSDEGEYTCTVISTPDKGDGRATLQVSAPPSADVTPANPTIEEGTEKTVMCEVHNFYPKDISIRWGQYRKGSPDYELLEMWTSVKSWPMNSDGTYNVTSLLTLSPKMEDNGNIYSCIISHRSLRTKLSRSLTLTVTEREDTTKAVITAVLLTLLAVLFLGLLGFLYIRFIKKDPPILSEITGNDELIDMTRTTLTCQIMDFRPNDIEISVCMRRSGEEEEMRTIYTWRSEGHLTPVKISRDYEREYEEGICMLEGRPRMMNRSPGYEGIPLQLEVTPVISMKNLGAFICQCSLQITPSYDLDNGAELSVHVNHPALTSPVWVHRILNIIGVPPKLLSIISPERVIHDEQLTLTCPISGFKPRALSITWLRKERDYQLTELVIWNLWSNTIHSEKYSHRVQEDEHEHKSYSCISALTMKPTIREDDGVTYICRTFHPASILREEREQILKVTAVPVLDPIMKNQEVVCVGEKLDLSCRIHSFYPSDIQVTWYTEDDIIISPPTTAPLPNNEGLYHVTSTSSYTPTMKDLGKKFRCQVQHVSLSRPKPVIWTLEELCSPPTLDNIQCDPAQPELGKTVTLSCAISNMYPGNPIIRWYRGLTKFKYGDWTENFKKDPESRICSGTTKLTFTPTSEEHGVHIRLEITHGGKTIVKEYPLHLKGLPVVSEIYSDRRNPDYGKPLTLRCDVIGCNPRDTPEVTWSGSGGVLEKGQQRETRGGGDNLSCSLTITPTARDYGKVYSCRVTCKGMKNPIEKKIHLRLPERPPTLSDIIVHPKRVTANQEASFQVTISGYSPRDLQIKWYKEFSTFPQSEVTISDPEIGLDGLYKSSSTLTFTPKMSDHNTTLRCEVTHSPSKTIREKRYTLHLTGDSRKAEETKTGAFQYSPVQEKCSIFYFFSGTASTGVNDAIGNHITDFPCVFDAGPEKKFQIREIKCVTERPRVGEEVTLVAYIEECQADSAEFTWSTGMFPIDGEIENRQDGTNCTSTITFTPEDSDCPIKLEVFYKYETAEESFTLPLV
ncbi:hemicentin-1-like isoform X3 [Aquarana catesbeiana]|uniref:hemicentin-1-like isoform X3 n=1 Tax=Aquarana catesbeiana TaxID=8400 RepID=UPI003CC99446